MERWTSLNAPGSDHEDPAHHPTTDTDRSTSPRTTDGSEDANQIAAAINAQSASLKTLFERMTIAIETLKQKPQSPDKKIAFWTAYKSLADEFDKEIQEKYKNDLDTSLIFAGLFSAVSSAFIIQIQPDLQPDPNGPTQALLALLVQNITGLPLALLPPEVSTSQAPVASSVVVAQSLLYFSLFATLMAALLAVLGKQWLLHYNSVGERGTIAERGLERQRKFDGMRRWRFDLVMQVFPLLLQVSLLLFATALSIYLWKIHHIIAAIALTLTGLGCLVYAGMIISAVVSPDSPFQTSLSFVLKAVMEQFPVPQTCNQQFRSYWTALLIRLHPIYILFWHCWTACTRTITQITPPLPLLHTPELVEPIDILGPPEPPSKEVTAVVWALEASTDPGLVETTAELIPELQWPLDLDFRQALKRLDDTFASCIQKHEWNFQVRDRMANRATACIRAFWLFDLVAQENRRTPDLWTYNGGTLQSTTEDLRSIEFWTRRPFNSDYFVEPVTPWALRFIAARRLPEEALETVLDEFNLIPDHSEVNDSSILADFLFCLLSFFIPTTPRDRSVREKRDCIALLMGMLFENLVRRLTDIHPLDVSTANKIAIKVGHCTNRKFHGFSQYAGRYRCINTMYRYCSLPDVSQEAIASVLRMLRIDYPWDWERGCIAHIDRGWLSQALESVSSLNRESHFKFIGDLWQALFLLFPDSKTLSVESRQVLLSFLSIDEEDPDFEYWDKEAGRIAYFACGVLTSKSASHWFADNELCRILKQPSVWANLRHQSSPNRFYLSLCSKLSRDPGWKKTISEDLPGWLEQWPTIMGRNRGFDGGQITEEDCTQFRLVLCHIWDVDETEANEFGTEATLAMVINTLTKTWNQANPTDWGINQVKYYTKLLDRTVIAAFSARIQYNEVLSPSWRFQDMMIGPLGQALKRAGQNIKPDNPWNLKDIIGKLANLLLRLGVELPDQLSTPPPCGIDALKYWKNLQGTWLEEVSVLRNRFREVSKSLAVNKC